jgi:hypothetical protein
MSEEKTPPAQHQDQQPGSEKKMDPPPVFIHDHYRSAGKLKDKVAIVTGGDSGIGRAVAVHFAAEGAKVLISYLDEHDDARTACEEIEKRGGEVISHAGDIGEREVCQELIDTVLARWGRLDAADSLHLRRRLGRRIRRQYAHGTSGRAGGSGARVCLPGLR